MRAGHYRRAYGQAQIYLIGTILSSFAIAPFAIDIPMYVAVHSQLQTAVDAAALAGARALPSGDAEAQAAAVDIGSQNPVLGRTLSANEFTFVISENHNSFKAEASVNVPTTIGNLLCALQGSFKTHDEGEQYGEGGEENAQGGFSVSECSPTLTTAEAEAMPVARDTMIVIDTSTSMDDLGHNQPFADVKTAAIAYIDRILELDSESADRIGVAHFDRYGHLDLGLTALHDSPDFQDVRDAITDMDLYSGSGWCTNYHAGIKVALDEMIANARPNSHKSILFMTDGYANLPEDPSNRMSTCINYYNTGVYYQNRRRTSQANTYFNLADTCATNYGNYLVNTTQNEANRAIPEHITIHTIQIGGDDSASLSTIRTLMRNNSWDPELLDYFADNTDGEQYAAENYDSDAILDIYTTIAQDVKMQLTSSN